MYDLCDLRRLILDLRCFEDSLKKQTDLSLNEALCLCQTGKGNLDPSGLAHELEISPSRLSRILDSLETKGLLTRSIADADRRTICIDLTTTGQQMVETLHCVDISIPHHLEEAIKTLHKTGEK
ncbi:MAG: MarR family transcriptional regulator [Sphaerochaetaceae bacterium]|nr:MarR family transcriptional regulator [Sphaerochaetaceae bacterium]